MPIIVDLDDLSILNNTTTGDIFIDVATKKITIGTLNAISGTGEGAETGISGQALYSFLKDRWKNDATEGYIKYPFPMEAITPEQFEFINGWEPVDDATRKLIRTAGWAEREAGSAVTKQEWIGVVSLGTLGAADVPYYELVDGGVSAGATSFTFAGRVNEAVKVYGDVSNGNINYLAATDEFNIFAREQGKLYAASNNTSIGATDGLTYITYRFPLTNSNDLKITATDADIIRSETVSAATWLSSVATYTVTGHGYAEGDYVFIRGVSPAGFNVSGNITVIDVNSFSLPVVSDPTAFVSAGTADSIWTGITVDYYTTPQVGFDVNANLVDEDYSIVIRDESTVATNQEIYEKIQYLLRQNSDINSLGDAGIKIGRLEAALLAFIGDTLKTGVSWATAGDDGVVIDGLASANKATIEVVADDGISYFYPKIASGIIQFGANAVSGDTKYVMFFTSNYGTVSSEIVDDNSAVDINGTYAGSDIPFDFAYTKNTQDGRTPDTPANITLIGIGLDGGQWIRVDYTINEGSGNNFLLAPAQERNYSDPAP
jgi:hypothetical protein